MCGIVGIYNYGRSEAVDASVLERMNQCLIHRGPDDGGVVALGPIGLGMRRLAIVDVAGGHQPMSDADKKNWIVFNGEIFNFQELRSSLQAKGHTFRTSSDTEVILKLYQEKGEDCVKYFRGMFAFALWDGTNQKLILARDRFGKKPLYYSSSFGRICWASEMQALLQGPDVSRAINPMAVDLYLSLQYVPSPHSIFQSVQKLPPAHLLVHEKGQTTLKKYWELPKEQKNIFTDQNQAKHEIRTKLEESTQIRMISEVPLGAFLSGGVDSACIVGLMSKMSTRSVKTFSIGFEDQSFSELDSARITARHFGTEHTEFVVKPNMAEVLPLLARHYGEPFSDSSALPSYYVARETRRHVTVALNGDGGDENFGGYDRYLDMRRMQAFDGIPMLLRKALALAAEIIPAPNTADSYLRKGKRFLSEVLPADVMTRYAMTLFSYREDRKRALYSSEFRQKLKNSSLTAESYLQNIYSQTDRLEDLQKFLYVDFSSYLPECLMTKIDIATMANSLEGRSPFLDHEFVELCFRVPSQWKISGGTTKWILKEAFRDLVPQEILQGKKMGFGIPIDAWFRVELKKLWEETVLSGRAINRGYFNKGYLEKLHQEHMSRKFDHGYRMWTLLMLELWHQEFNV